MLRLLAKKLLAPVLNRHPPIVLSPVSLYLYFEAIFKTQGFRGAVVEIGCFAGGTAAIARNLLKGLSDKREYVCIDTFSGFVKNHVDTDVRLGNDRMQRGLFSSIDIGLVRTVLRQNGAQDVRLIQGDIAALDEDVLPPLVSVCLIDVDLYVPVLAALRKIYPRMESGGAVLVDDCSAEAHWQARKAYAEFVAEHRLPHDVRYGIGFINSGSK